LCFFFIWYFRHALYDAFKLSTTIGLNFLWLPILFIIWNLFATAGWFRVLQSATDRYKNAFWHLYNVRIQSQSLNLILPVSGIGGEALRSVKTSAGNGYASSLTSVTIDKLTDIISETVLAIAGVVIAIEFFPYQKILLAFSCSLLILIAIGILFWQRMMLLVMRFWKFQAGKEILLSIINNKKLRTASVKAFFYHLTEHLLMAVEILVVANLTDIQIGFRELLYINTISSVFNIVFIIIPGRVGSYECSLAYAFSQLSLSPAAGISIALIRRARQLLICLAGLLLMVLTKNKLNNRQFPVVTLNTINNK
jgi:uncharacterized membrane protein YbhN (UPF0104 family)